MPKTKSKKRSSSSSLKNKKSFSKGQLGFFALLFAVVGAFMLAVSLAAPAEKGGGKPGSGASGSLSMVMVTDVNSDGLPNYKDQIGFNVVSATYSKWVELLCYQNGTLVSSQQVGYFSEYPWGTTFSLGPTYLWNGGPADCTATLFTLGNHSRRVVMATLPVHVNP